ncbi:MAG: PilZ domain-containing protein [Acidobacteriota bacterium]|nr:PilZ domain-containing protein [Acidobacteriota bacterium]
MGTTNEATGIERRASPRANAQFLVRYGANNDEMLEAKTCDISATGIGLMGPKQYPGGAEIELRFRAPEGSKGDLLTMRALVRHSTPNRMGLEFVNVPSSDHGRVRDMINRLMGTKAK